jgi:hypothetical protein
MTAPLNAMVRIQTPFLAIQVNNGNESECLIAKLVAGPDWCTKYEYFIDCSHYAVRQLLRQQRVYIPPGSPVHSVPEVVQNTVTRPDT